MITSLSPEKIYSEKRLHTLNPLRIPKHIAIIMDGNRRWAARRGLLPIAGHMRGAETLVQIVSAASELGVEVLTVYAFSTENWKRNPVEVEALMKLFKTFIAKQKDSMIKEGVRLDIIGDTTRLPADVKDSFDEVIQATKGGNKFNLVLALNYGGRDELKRAVSAIVDDCLSSKLSKDAINEELISSYLDTSKWQDPDLLIRTSGENRLSNFLLWQISYSEVFLTDVLWPDFSEQNLLEAILEYQKRELRIGK
ncbi:MAG: isoprenyl transferase [Simkaniaceae bacterium]|nr:isoprenyl transferase [Candidatus Sacchlamyda saccharinae]